MECLPLKAKNTAPASSRITCAAAMSHGATFGSTHTSICPSANIMASGVPPRHRKAQKEARNSAICGASFIRFRLFREITAFPGLSMEETRSRRSLRNAPAPRAVDRIDDPAAAVFRFLPGALLAQDAIVRKRLLQHLRDHLFALFIGDGDRRIVRFILR